MTDRWKWMVRGMYACDVAYVLCLALLVIVDGGIPWRSLPGAFLLIVVFTPLVRHFARTSPRDP